MNNKQVQNKNIGNKIDNCKFLSLDIRREIIITPNKDKTPSATPRTNS